MVDYSSKISAAEKKLKKKAAYYNQEVPRPSRVQIFVILMMAIPAFFLRKYFVAFLLMILVTALSVITNRFELGRFGLELATFSSVTMAMIFPPKIAAALAFVYIVLQIFSGSTPGIYLTWVIPTYTIAAYTIATLNLSDIATVGIYTTVISQSFFAMMTFLMSRSRVPKYLQYAAFNLVFNFLMFQSFGRPLLSLVKN
ncbi:MAG: hypothetical protein ABEK10_03460 [Candidatus Nanosalina sp.]